MRRIVRVPKVSRNWTGRAPKGKTWSPIAGWTPILPDEMEKIVELAAHLSKCRLYWVLERQRYFVYCLLPARNVEGKEEARATEALEWLKPLHDKSREWAEANQIEFSE